MGYHNRTDERKRKGRNQNKPLVFPDVKSGPRKEIRTHKRHHLCEAFKNFEEMKNNKIEEIDLNDIDKLTPYQVFLATMFRMGRDTKALAAAGIRQKDMPKLMLTTRGDTPVVLSYLAESNVWGIEENGEDVKHFNPTALTGVLEFISAFHPEHIKQSCIETVRSFEELKHINHISIGDTQRTKAA
jgi:hypothetical protein